MTSLQRAGQFAYEHRRTRKRDFRRLWITRINAAARINGLSYSALIAGLKREGHAVSCKLVRDKRAQKRIWEVRKAGLGATAFVRGHADTWEGWEDSAVPPDKAGDYLRALEARVAALE